MNNIVQNNATVTLAKDFSKFFSDNGRYACIVLGMYMMYDLAKTAMEKQIPMFFNVNETDGITVKLGENNYSAK